MLFYFIISWSFVVCVRYIIQMVSSIGENLTKSHDESLIFDGNILKMSMNFERCLFVNVINRNENQREIF